MNENDQNVLIDEEKEWSKLIYEALHIGIKVDEILRFIQTKEIQNRREVAQIIIDQEFKLYSVYQKSETKSKII